MKQVDFTTKKEVSTAILSMTYGEFIDMVNDLVQMQIDAKDDGWKWDPTKTHGQFGLAQMIYSWAESQ